MSQGLVERQNLEDIADAIRSKNGSSDTYTPAEMAQAISGIHTADEVVLVQKTVNTNGQYNASDDSADGYSGVRVNVPNTYSASDEGKVVSNGDLVAQTTKQITANGTHDTTTNNSVSVDVPNSYAASDNGKVVVNQALVAQTSKNINANGTHDTTANNSVVVDVPNSYAAADEGKVVSGGALVGQTSRNVTMNGTYDTTENNEVVVNVPTSGGGTLIQKNITQNGTYNASDDNADGYSSVTVNVSGGSSSALIDYDFTKLSGTIRGVTYNSNGATFPNSPTLKAYIPIISSNSDITLYVDVGDMNFPTATYHKRFIMGSYSNGFIYRNTGKWAFYSGSWEESDITDKSYFANSKVKVYIDSSKKWHIYKNNILVFEPINVTSIDDLMIGSSEQYSIIDAVITGVRVYQGDYTEI